MCLFFSLIENDGPSGLGFGLVLQSQLFVENFTPFPPNYTYIPNKQ